MVPKCWSMKLETGCVALGTTTFVLSVIKIAIAVTIISEVELNHKTELASHVNLTASGHHLNLVFGLNLDRDVIEVSASLVLVFAFLWLVFSALLVFGIIKRKTSFVQAYFLFGSALCMVFLVTALLEVVGKMWPISIATLVLTLIYARCLMSVYSTYELMQQEDAAGDQEYLITEEEFNFEE